MYKCLMYDKVVKMLHFALCAHDDVFVQMCFSQILCVEVSWHIFQCGCRMGSWNEMILSGFGVVIQMFP